MFKMCIYHGKYKKSWICVSHGKCSFFQFAFTMVHAWVFWICICHGKCKQAIFARFFKCVFGASRLAVFAFCNYIEISYAHCSCYAIYPHINPPLAPSFTCLWLVVTDLVHLGGSGCFMVRTPLCHRQWQKWREMTEKWQSGLWLDFNQFTFPLLSPLNLVR